MEILENAHEMLSESRMTCGARERQKQSTKEIAIDYRTLIAIDRCLVRNPDTKMEVQGSVHDMLMESRIVCGVGVCIELCVVLGYAVQTDDGKKLIKFVKGLCKKMLIQNVNFTCTVS